MKKILLATLAMSMGHLSSTSAAEPVWDLSKDEIPAAQQSGPVERKGKSVVLRDGAAFAVPARAFSDQKNFTVQVTASISALVDGEEFLVMKKESAGQDDGFSFYINYKDKPYYARRVSTVVNNVYMSEIGIGGTRGPQVETPYTFTIAVRNGFAGFYVDDKPYKKCFMELIANDEPLWIGGKARANSKPMNVVIHDAKVYGPDFTYVSKKEPKTEHPRGVVAGKGWALDIPKIEYPEWPKVLIYGDSISMGYRRYFIPEMLKKGIYVFHCCHFVGGNVPKAALEEMAGRFKFDAVVFNNGLHSLHWTPDKVSDKLVHDRMRDLAQCFKKGAPQAKIYYLMTTPHTAKTKPVDSLGDKNDVVIRLNTISEQVMKEENIEVIDVYPALAKRLELASGDGYHWKGEAYKFLSQELSKRILPLLGKE